MLSKISTQLKSIWHGIQQEFRDAPVKTSLAAIGLCTLLVTVINSMVQLYFPNLAIKFLSVTTETNLLLTILGLGLLVLSLSILRQKAKIFLDEPKVNILKLLYSQNMSVDQISVALKVQTQTAAFHLEELANLNMVIVKHSRKSIPGNLIDGRMPQTLNFYTWTIRQPGRKYLHENKLVDA